MLSWSFVVAALVLALVPSRLPPRARATILATLSLVAAALFWQVPATPLVLGSLAVFVVGRTLPRLSASRRAWTLAAAIAAVVLVLVRLKLPAGPTATLAGTTTVLGVSYLALKLIQHLVDAASDRTRDVDLATFLTTLFFLPTYPAGPIERTTDFTRELARTPPGWMERLLGVERVVLGLGKKLLLADPLLAWGTPLLRDAGAVPRLRLLGAVYAFALGLYLDFAGYSDVAIGVARLDGVRVRENFDWPYLRRNPALLWQHWHMSLTSWLRDYVFIPTARRLLRLTRRPLASQVAAQAVTMLVCGLWHGVAWNFVAWGAYQALGLGTFAVWRSLRGPAPSDAPLRDAFSTAATFHFFAFGLVFFACDVSGTLQVVGRLLGFV